jgi:hypothetical protein
MGSSPDTKLTNPVGDNIVFTSVCSLGTASYDVQCKVTVESMKDKSAAGFDAFTIENQYGSQAATFQVIYQGMSLCLNWFCLTK